MIRNGNIIWTARIARSRVRCGAAQDGRPTAGRNIACCAILVPCPAVFAEIDNLKERVVDGRGKGRQGGVARVDIGRRITRGIAERGEDLVLIGPCHEQEGLGHLSGLAVR